MKYTLVNHVQMKMVMWLSWLLLIILCHVFTGVCPVFGFSTHNITISRAFDQIQASVDSPITITVNFTSLEPFDLRGFYYAVHIPEGLSVDTESVRINGSVISSYIDESGLSEDIYNGCIPYRWILETPTAFGENNPVSQNSTVEIVYSVTSSQEGALDFDEFHWVGYYQEAVDGQGSAFGHSQTEDQQTISFFENTPPQPPQNFRKMPF